jgi:hypothetical protein
MFYFFLRIKNNIRIDVKILIFNLNFQKNISSNQNILCFCYQSLNVQNVTTKQSNKLTMAKTLKQFFASEQSKYTGNNPLTARISDLNAIVNVLESLADVQTTDTTASTDLKTDARSLMIDLTAIQLQIILMIKKVR